MIVAKHGEFDKNLNIQNLLLRNFKINFINFLKTKIICNKFYDLSPSFLVFFSKKINTDTYINSLEYCKHFLLKVKKRRTK